MGLKLILLVFSIYDLVLNDVNARDNSDTRSRHFFDLDLYENVLDAELCDKQLQYLSEENSLLGLRFLDAGFRIPKGILTGNFMDFGNYFQCLEINEETPVANVEGKYCLMELSMEQENSERISSPELSRYLQFYRQENNENLKMINQYKSMNTGLQEMLLGKSTKDESSEEDLLSQLVLNTAICIPKPCTVEQALTVLPFNITTSLGVVYKENFCRLPNDQQWVPADYIAIILLCLIGLLTILCTYYDLFNTVFLRKGPKEINKKFQIFSVYTNTRRILTFNSNPDSIKCLDGIRSLAMMWMLLGHTFVLPGMALEYANPLDALKFTTSFTSLWITAGTITVDTFFLLSGMLLVYTTVGKVSSGKMVRTVHLFYLNRLLRMFPILAFGVLLEASLIHRFVDGPYKESTIVRVDQCRTNWWSTLLYVQNYVSVSEICLGHTWYLAIDMQLHILSPLVLFFVLGKKRVFAWLSLLGALILSLAASSIYVFLMNFPVVSYVPSREEEGDFYMQRYYVNTLTRASPFIVGMIIGYLLHTWRRKEIVISKVNVVILWTLTIVVSSTIVMCHYFILRDDWDYQTIDNILNSFMRPAWGLCLSWLIIACVHGYGGPANWFLSLSMWKLPARISYSMYILHYPMMFAITSSSLTPLYFSVNFYFYNFLADYTLAFIVGFLVTLVIDLPFSSLIRLIIGAGPKRVEKPKEDLGKLNDDTPGILVKASSENLNFQGDEVKMNPDTFNEIDKNNKLTSQKTENSEM